MKRKIYIACFCLIIIIGFLGFTKAQESPLLHFIHITDIHLNSSKSKDAERLLGSSEKLLKDAVNQINEIKDLDFVLATGDLVDIPEEELVDKFIEITMSLKYPLYVTTGNHDISVGGGLGKQGFIKKFNAAKDSTSFTAGMPYYSFSPNEQFTFICFDGTTDTVVTAHGQIQDSKQFEWLKSELEKNKDKYVIIAGHFPLIEPYKSKSHNFLEPDRSKFLDLINSYKNVLGVFTGHYHAARLIKSKNKIHNSGPAVIQWPNAFREVFITKDKKNLVFDFKWHPVNGEELRNKSKENSDSWGLTQGASEDRIQTVKLKIY